MLGCGLDMVERTRSAYFRRITELDVRRKHLNDAHVSQVNDAYCHSSSSIIFFQGNIERWHQKGHIILDFNEAIDGGVAVTSAGPYANHLHLTPER